MTEQEAGLGEKNPAAGEWFMWIAMLLVMACLGTSGWIYWRETRVLSSPVMQRVDQGMTKAALVAVGGWGLGGVCLLAGTAIAGRCWRRRLQAAHDKGRESHAAAAMLKMQFTESLHSNQELHRRLSELDSRTAEAEQQARNLTSSNAALQEEINKRNRAERALTQKRQELESSKSVLELHVQKRTHELQTLQRRYEMILNSAGEGICGLDLEGRATFVNPAVAKITGWQIEELIGKPEQEIFRRNGTNGHAAETGLNAAEQIFYRKDGSCFPVELVKTPINENGKEVGAVLVFKDITERKRVEETLSQKAAELARSNAELEQFAFVASHDLQEPLRKIQAFGDRLKVKSSRDQSPEVNNYLERMQSAAARMQTLINDLLTFSRVIRGSEPFAPVELTSVAREVLGDLEVRIEKTKARIEIGELPTIDADPMQIRQLMLNLIGNALKFQPPEGVPVVKVQGRILSAVSGEQLCEISIQDNGIGFDEKYLEKIFAVFQRLHGRTDYEGTGVGLAVCRRITDRHGGTITARSKPGEGATFIVTLPVRQTRAEARP